MTDSLAVALLAVSLLALIVVVRGRAGTSAADQGLFYAFVLLGWVWITGYLLGYDWPHLYDQATVAGFVLLVVAFWIRTILWLRTAREHQRAFEAQLRAAGLLHDPDQPD